MQVRSLGLEDPLEEGMATHSSILDWRIHGQRSLAGYSPWGHKESDTTEQLTHTHTKFHSTDVTYLLYPFLDSDVQRMCAQSCQTLCDPVDCSLPGSSVHGIFQARILEWVAMPSSRRSS